MRVSWTAPNNNGDAVSAYTLTTLRGGAVVATQQVADTMQNVTVDNSETNYTFTVSATNKAGTSGTSAPSPAVRAAGKPGQVNSGTVKATGTSGQLEVTFTPLTDAQRNGSTPAEITYSYNADGRSGPINAGGGTIGGLTNGRDITVTIIATSTKNSMSGDAKAIGAGNPYGPANAPNIDGRTSAKGDGEVHWTWNDPNTNGRPLSHYEVSYEGGGWINVGKVNRYDRSAGGWDQARQLRVRAVTIVNGAIGGPVTSRSGADPTPPPPTSWNITATPVRSCTEPRKGTDSYVAGNPSQCTGEGKWLDAGAASTTDRYQVWYKTSNNPSGIWYHLTSGMAAGNWIRCDTSSLGCNPPAGMPNR
jgi:hypothetical protein